MTGFPPRDSDATTEAPAVSGETVRAYNPMLTAEGTVRAPAPTAPTPPAVSGDTVRARMPSPAPFEPSASDFEELEPLDVELLEPGPQLVATPLHDVPLSRSEAPTLPEAAADPLPGHADIGRCQPPAVAGEVSVVDPEPLGMFDPRPPRPRRASTEPAEQAAPTRADPPAVVGEVSVQAPADEPPPPAEARVMTTTGPQTVLPPDALTGSGPQPMLGPDAMGAMCPRPVSSPPVVPGRQRVITPEPGTYAYAETTGPQPVAQAEITVPHSVMHGGTMRHRPDRTLWYVALALVLLAVGGVVLVVSRAS